ncbi:MAG: cytochrome c biogenesis protein CcsA [Bacteroidales bacterium]|nr:cytochrome c biogenesis protein CcsA [Bacteroidales bacterium]
MKCKAKTMRVVLVAIVVAVLAAATIVEKLNPEVHLYSTWWFSLLLAVLAVATIASAVQGKMWRRPSLLLIHAAIPLILLGGGLTTWTGVHGSIKLMPGQPSSTFTTDGREATLPFSLTLESFEVIPYAGTRTPMDFHSRVSIAGQSYDISMNHILRHSGYRFYQEDYDTDGSSTLSIARDPWGIAVTYIGYALLLLGLIGLMVSPRGRFRTLLRAPATLLLLLLAASSVQAAPPTLPRHAADQMGRMYVLYKGRVCPVQTLAKDFTTKLTGKATYQGLTPEQVLSGFLFYYSQWAAEPMVKIKGAGDWTLEGSTHHVDSRTSIASLAFLDHASLSPQTDKNIRAAAEKYNLARMLTSGRLLKLFPVADSTGTLGWYGQNDDVPLTIGDDEYLFIRHSIGYWQELVVNADWIQLNLVFEKTRAYQQQHAVALPTPSREYSERLYNSLTTGRWLPMLCITLGLLAFACSLLARHRPSLWPRWLGIACTAYLSLLTAYLLLIFIFRWIAGGHAPMAGGFDSMNLMSIVIGLVALAFSCHCRKTSISNSQFSVSAAMLTIGFCQLVAMISGANPPITNLMPVLNSPLLTLHVAVIMCAYALLFFVMMCGVAGLIVGGEDYRRTTTLLLYPAVFLLALGIIIGAVWANISWGNYWSWDPKEVWALITLIVYALPLHPTLLHRPRTFYLYCTLAFLSVVITYFGVNLLLGGMHAYN